MFGVGIGCRVLAVMALGAIPAGCGDGNARPDGGDARDARDAAGTGGRSGTGGGPSGGAGGALTGGAGGALTGGAGGALTGGAGGALTGGSGNPSGPLSCAPTTGWASEVVLAGDGRLQIEGQMVSDSTGGLHAATRVMYEAGNSIMVTYKPPGGTWTPPFFAFRSGSAKPRIATDPSFRTHVVYTGSGNGDHVSYRVSSSGGPWSVEPAESTALHQVEGLALATDVNGNPMVLASAPGPGGAFMRSSGGTWMQQALPGATGTNIAAVAPAASGRVLLVYQNVVSQRLESIVVGVDGSLGAAEVVAANAVNGASAVAVGNDAFAIVYSDLTGVHRAGKTGTAAWTVDAVSPTGRLACSSRCLATDGLGRLHTLILNAGAIVYAHTTPNDTWQLDPADFGDTANEVMSLDIDPSGVLHAFAHGGSPTATTSPFRHLSHCPAANAGKPRVPAPETAGTWQQRVSPTVPWWRFDGQGLVFDPSQHELVMFGGQQPPFNGTIAPPETWAYPTNGAGWVLRAGSTGNVPSGRSGHGMVYDPTRSRVVLMGGVPTGDVWEWDGATATWTPRPAAGSPPPGMVPPAPGTQARLAFDVARAKVIVLTPGTCPTNCWGLWDWEPATGAFTPRPSTAPMPVTLTSIAYDSSSGSIIGHGAGATWEWNTTTGAWTDRTGTTPAPAAGELVNGPNGRFVIYDGSTTWEWARGNGVWKPRTLTQVGPPGRNGAFITYHPELQTVWLFGGRPSTDYVVVRMVDYVYVVFNSTFEWRSPAQLP